MTAGQELGDRRSAALTVFSWLCAAIVLGAAPPVMAEPDGAVQARLSEAYGTLPLSFEANDGQVDRSVKFLSRGRGATLFLTPAEAVLSLAGPQHEATVVRMRVSGGTAIHASLEWIRRRPSATTSWEMILSDGTSVSPTMPGSATRPSIQAWTSSFGGTSGNSSTISWLHPAPIPNGSGWHSEAWTQWRWGRKAN